MAGNLIGTMRKFLSYRASTGDNVWRTTTQESQATAQVEPPGMEMSRAGKRFMLGNSAAITGIAPSTALLTTAPQWSLWNGNSFKSLVLEELGFYETAGTNGVGGMGMFCLYNAPSSTGLYAGTSIVSMSGSAQTSGAALKTAVTITAPAAPTWYPFGTNPSANVGAFPAGVQIEHRTLQGRLIVPPGMGLGLAVIALAGTTPLFAPFAQWIEVETELE